MSASGHVGPPHRRYPVLAELVGRMRPDLPPLDDVPDLLLLSVEDGPTLMDQPPLAVARFGPPPRRKFVSNLSVRRSHRRHID